MVLEKEGKYSARLPLYQWLLCSELTSYRHLLQSFIIVLNPELHPAHPVPQPKDN